MNVNEIIFFRAQAEEEGLQMMKNGYSKKEKAMQEARILAVLQIIEEAGLRKEYEFWKRQHA